MTLRQRLVTFPPARLAYRLRIGWSERRSMRRRPREAARWLARGREMANFTYELDNEDELVTVTARVAEVSEDEVRRLFAELRDDDELRGSLREKLLERRRERETEPLYGGRSMWYALARLRRPRAIAELGSHDGLGTAVLLRAVERNAEEGFPGHVVSFDLSDRAGWLVSPAQRPDWTHHVGDVKDTLAAAVEQRPVELTVHDTTRDLASETFEIETVLRQAPGPVTVISRDARKIGALAAICEQHGATYHAFQELPRGHWWPGGEYGIAVLPPG